MHLQGYDCPGAKPSQYGRACAEIQAVDSGLRSVVTGPKYINTADTELFNKRPQLLGLHEGRAALAAGAVPVLVEGLLDAVAFTASTEGTHVVVAPLGSVFTDRQADQLQAFSRVRSVSGRRLICL